MEIYIGSIPFKWKDKDLITLFENFGTVEKAAIVIDKITRQNKGFGFVTMNDSIQAQNAIRALNGSEHLGIVIKVQASDPQSKEKKFGRQKTEPKVLKPLHEKPKNKLPPWLRKEY
jgi:RNA recognition motif-containing protein